MTIQFECIDGPAVGRVYDLPTPGPVAVKLEGLSPDLSMGPVDWSVAEIHPSAKPIADRTGFAIYLPDNDNGLLFVETVRSEAMIERVLMRREVEAPCYFARDIVDVFPR